MQSWMERYAGGGRSDALAELTTALGEFAHDGLTQLAADLSEHAVRRGSWGGCVLSYRAGRGGSVRRDQRGRARTAFTVLWDDGVLTDEEVLARVRSEIDRRRSLPDVCPKGLETESATC
jgi:hypothetical protein